MSTRVTQVEKELMWKLYQKLGVIKIVAEKVGRSPSTVSRYIHEYEAAVGTASVIINAVQKE